MTYKILYITANNNNSANVSSCYTFSHCLTNVIPSHPLYIKNCIPRSHLYALQNLQKYA